jgi:hypothetical protein
LQQSKRHPACSVIHKQKTPPSLIGCEGSFFVADKVRLYLARGCKWVILPKIIASGGYISPSATSKQLTSLREEITHLQSQLETEQAKTLYMANFIDDGLQQAKTQAKIDWQCESSDVKGDPVVFAKAMIQERDEIAAKLRQYKDFGKAMHFFLSEAHPKILEEAATVWDVPKLPE